MKQLSRLFLLAVFLLLIAGCQTLDPSFSSVLVTASPTTPIPTTRAELKQPVVNATPTLPKSPTLPHEVQAPLITKAPTHQPFSSPPTITKTQPLSSAIKTEGTDQLLKQILTEPEQYVDQEITLEGVLAVEGQRPQIRFFLQGQRHEKLAVSAWAPLETLHPPQGRAASKSMLYYVGRRLRLTGILAKEDQAIILKVVTVEEL